jgi:cell wall-associated NlpC family hydrolase
VRVTRLITLTITASLAVVALAARPAGAASGPQAPAGTYIVQSGDFLIGIAARAGVSLGDLLRTNNLQLQAFIVPGQKVVIPAGGRVPTVVAPAAATVAAPATPARSPRIDVAIDVAKAQIGKPYQYGYDGPNAFDCSGLVRYAFGKAGLMMLHNTLLQKAQFNAVATKDLRVGDVVFFHQDFSHEAIYLGNGLILHAPAPHMNVQISSVPLGWVTAAIRPLV